MTDAPERIWFVHVGKNIVPNSKRTGPKDVEYIRADLTPSPEVVKELVEALRAIADEAYVTVKANGKGLDYKHLYEGWRKIATTRIDVARAALAKWEGGQ